MSPTTLYREGSDLDDLLAELDSRYPGQVRVVEVTHPREGGVLGFFAKQRVGVHYRLVDASSETGAGSVAGSGAGSVAGTGAGTGAGSGAGSDGAFTGRDGFVGRDGFAGREGFAGRDESVGRESTSPRNDSGAAGTTGVRDGFGPDREMLRAVLAKRAVAAPAAHPASTDPGAATGVASGSGIAEETGIAAVANNEVPSSRGPVASSNASSAPFAQILADIALRKASGDAPAAPVSRAATTRATTPASNTPAAAYPAHSGSDAAATGLAPAAPADVVPEPVLNSRPAEPMSAPASSAPFAEFVPLAVANASPEEKRPSRRRKRAVPMFDAAATPLPGLAPAAEAPATAGTASVVSAPAGEESTGASAAAAATSPAPAMSGSPAATVAPHVFPAVGSPVTSLATENPVHNSGDLDSEPDRLAPVRPGPLSWPLAAPDPVWADATPASAPTSASAVGSSPTAASNSAAATVDGSATGTAARTASDPAIATATDPATAIATATAEHREATPFAAEPVSPRETSYSLRNHSVAGPSTPLTLRRQLLELGVPVDRVPDDAVHAYAAVEALVRRLAPAPHVPVGNGQILVVAGPARDVVAAADAVVAANPGAFDAIWTHGCAAISSTRRVSTTDRVLTSPAHAKDMADDVRSTATGTTLIVVATDFVGSDSAEVVGAIRPDAVWSAVDATRKSADTRRALRAAGRSDAIVVANAEHSTSPATVWEFDLPIAMVDGRPSSEPGWAVLLLGKLSELEESACSTALC